MTSKLEELQSLLQMNSTDLRNEGFENKFKVNPQDSVENNSEQPSFHEIYERSLYNQSKRKPPTLVGWHAADSDQFEEPAIDSDEM